MTMHIANIRRAASAASGSSDLSSSSTSFPFVIDAPRGGQLISIVPSGIIDRYPYNGKSPGKCMTNVVGGRMTSRASTVAIALLGLVEVTAVAQSQSVEPAILFENVRIFDGKS